MRVVLFANEENGLRGARAYEKEHAAELARHVLALEADLGDGRVMAASARGGPALAPLLDDVLRALAPLGVARSAEDAHGGADLIPLVAAGVPVLDLAQDATAYFDVHHTANDTIERVRRPEIDHAAAAFAVTAFVVADGSTDLGRIPPEKRDRD